MRIQVSYLYGLREADSKAINYIIYTLYRIIYNLTYLELFQLIKLMAEPCTLIYHMSTHVEQQFKGCGQQFVCALRMCPLLQTLDPPLRHTQSLYSSMQLLGR